jgi:hypothetical protein
MGNGIRINLGRLDRSPVEDFNEQFKRGNHMANPEVTAMRLSLNRRYGSETLVVLDVNNGTDEDNAQITGTDSDLNEYKWEGSRVSAGSGVFKLVCTQGITTKRSRRGGLRRRGYGPDILITINVTVTNQYSMPPYTSIQVVDVVLFG